MADIEINFSAQKLPRVLTAWGTYLGLAQPATGAEIAAYLKDVIRRVTKNIERKAAEDAIVVEDV